jgi:hypothetical protein
MRRGVHRSSSASRRTSGRATGRRLGWGLADQGISSLTNLALGLVVARSVDASEFGAFSLALVTYGVVLNLSRGLATDPLTVRYSGLPDQRWRSAVARSSGTATVVGLGAGAVCMVIGSAIAGMVGSCFVALGLTLPALMLQDSWRYAFFAAGQGRRAFVNDAIWAVALIPTMLLAGTVGTPFAYVLAWGGSALVAAVFGSWQIRLVPRATGVAEWLRIHRDLGVRYAVENVTDGLDSQLRAYGLSAITGLAAVGAVRGAQLLLGPFQALRMGIGLMAVPEATRVLARSPRRLNTFCVLLGWSQAIAGMAWGFALLLLPSSAGELLLGPLWHAASALLVPTTLAMGAASFYEGAFVGLRALGAARRSVRVSVARSVVLVVFGLAGAFVGGAAGSVWGAMVANLIATGVAWHQLQAAQRGHVLATPTELASRPGPSG